MKNIKTTKNVLITGASSGFGYAIAEILTSKGWVATNLGRNPSTVCDKIY